MQVAEAVHRYGKSSASACCRSTAARRWTRSCARSKRGVDVVVATPGRALDHVRRKYAAPRVACGRSSSTRPTRCSTWASPRTSKRSSPRRRPTGRPRSSPRRCRRASSTIAAKHLENPVRIAIAREMPAAGKMPQGPPDRVRRRARPQARRARPRARRRVADVRARLLPHAHRGRRADRERSTAAACAPRRCTAASRRTSATA